MGGVVSFLVEGESEIFKLMASVGSPEFIPEFFGNGGEPFEIADIQKTKGNHGAGKRRLYLGRFGVVGIRRDEGVAVDADGFHGIGEFFFHLDHFCEISCQFFNAPWAGREFQFLKSGDVVFDLLKIRFEFLGIKGRIKFL